MTDRKTIEVHAVGSTVLLNGSVEARVTGVFIRPGIVRYEVVWWNDRERNEEVVDEWEVTSENPMSAINAIL